MGTGTGFWLGVLALGAGVGNWAVYWPKIKAMHVPLRPRGHQAVMAAVLLLAGLAFANGPGALGGVVAGLAIPAAGMFLFFTLNSAMPHKTPAVAVGKPILNFTAKTADGQDFALSSLQGAPYLLKFFRGHW